MDRKSIIVIAVSVLLIMFWPRLVDQIYPPQPRGTNIVATATNQLAGTNQTTAPAPSLSSVGTNKPVPLTSPSAPEELVTITNENAVYIFTSHGGGLKLVELTKHQQAIECGKEVPGERKPAALNHGAHVPAMALLGGQALQGDNVFHLTKTETGVRAEKQLPNGLLVQKDFSFSTNYLLTVKARIENTSGAPIQLPKQEWVVGTGTPMNPKDDGMAVGAYWYHGKAEEVSSAWFDNKTLGCFPGTPHSEFVSPVAVSNNVGWAEAHNQFFTMAAIPSQPAAQVVSRKIELANSQDIRAVNPHGFTNGFQTALVYPETILKEKSAIEHEFTFYAGPKEYNTLAKIGSRFQNSFDKVMNFGMFSWFSEALLLFLNWLHSVGLNYGVAIIVLTIIVKLVFWPLTAASTRSMKRMQALAPKLKELQEKYKDNPQKFSQKQWELFRENKVNPMSGCVPMLVQIPVFIGLFQMLRSAIELRGASFLWACDLSQPDTILHLGSFQVNPLAIVMIGTSLWQAYVMPSPQDSDPQQKMLKYLPVLFLVFFYNVSAGLTLYWTVQNLLTIAQMRLTKNTEEPGATPPTKTPAPAAAPKKKK